jgi:dTDP-glucose 4,6-dehydratase
MSTLKRVLVTGAGGFIGHHLVRRLIDDGVDVVAFVRYTSSGHYGLLDRLPQEYDGAYEVHLGDLRDFESVNRAIRGCDTVMHLAALIGIPYSYSSPADVASVNVGGTLNVLQAARDSGGVKTIVTSTSEVYGTAQTVPITEDHVLCAQSPYAATKIGADQLALSFHRSFDLPVGVCRPFNTFGPGQSQRAVIPTIIAQALMSDHIELGALHPTRDMNFVSNTVDAFVTMAGSDRSWGETVQFGSGREISIGDLAQLILDIVGKDLQIVCTNDRVRPKASEVERLIASNAKANELYGWTPRISLEDGLRRTVAWMQENLDLHKLRGYAI